MFENLAGFRKYVRGQQQKGACWDVHESKHEEVPVVIFRRRDVTVTFNRDTGNMIAYAC